MHNLIFDYSKTDKQTNCFKVAEPHSLITNSDMYRDNKPSLPQVSEIDIVRHYTKLSTFNFGVDSGSYPLGSCTMKYNPKINEDLSNISSLKDVHPYQEEQDVQGTLQIMYETQEYLCKIFGYDQFSLQPSAGAQGEYAGLLIIKKYHNDNGNNNKNTIIIPDSGHGTNPASATCAGFKVLTVKTNTEGGVDTEHLKQLLEKHNDIAGLMLTNPNTLGLYEKNIKTIAALIHKKDGLLYYDGANANGTMEIAKPAEMGFDVAHLNLHKTFSTPHGGGGPGSGPVGVTKKLEKYLPGPIAIKTNNHYSLYTPEKTIGKLHCFHGNVGVYTKAYAYIKTLGSEGLKEASENAIINANYIMSRLKNHYNIPYKSRWCKHEFVISLAQEKREHGIKALDVAKRLIDYGIHPPTIYFPLIVSECLMIEPTETESKESLDEFCDVMIKISEEIKTSPELLKNAPHNTVVKRLDEVKAVKEPKLKWQDL